MSNRYSDIDILYLIELHHSSITFKLVCLQKNEITNFSDFMKKINVNEMLSLTFKINPRYNNINYINVCYYVLLNCSQHLIKNFIKFLFNSKIELVNIFSSSPLFGNSVCKYYLRNKPCNLLNHLWYTCCHGHEASFCLHVIR